MGDIRIAQDVLRMPNGRPCIMQVFGNQPRMRIDPSLPDDALILYKNFVSVFSVYKIYVIIQFSSG